MAKALIALIVGIAFALGIVAPAYGADIEYDVAQNAIILRGQAAVLLLELVRDQGEMQEVVKNLAQEIQRRADDKDKSDQEIANLRGSIDNRTKADVLADFIVNNYKDMKAEWQAQLKECKDQNAIQANGFKVIIDSQGEEIKDLRKDVRWARITSIVGLLLTIFTFGVKIF